MGEAIATIVHGLVALLELIFHAIAFLAERSVTLIAYFVSASYRARKRIEWQDNPASKTLALGFSGLCLATLCGLAIWIGLNSHDSDGPAKEAQPSNLPGSNHVTLELRTTSPSGSDQTVQISLQEGNIRNILSASNHVDLLSRIKTSMVGTGPTNEPVTNLSPRHSFELKFGRTVNGK